MDDAAFPITILSRPKDADDDAAPVHHRAVAIADVPVWSFTVGRGDHDWYALVHGLPTVAAFISEELPDSELGPFADELAATRGVADELLAQIAWVLDRTLRTPAWETQEV